MTKKKLRALWAKRFKAAFGYNFIDAMKMAKAMVNDSFRYDNVSNWSNQSTISASGYYDGVITETTLIGLDKSNWIFHNKGHLWEYHKI